MSAPHGAGAPKHTNRLARESSPYLLQHAHNPVDWFAWGEEAFAAARRRDVPIFLSVGYSTCYWCHVMERESFEDESAAKVMNERFVNIKVDREERPDVDDIYMAAVQMLTGRGGWPMSVFLEPATLRPYWGGTYFPPRPAHGLPSFTQALEGMSNAYRDQRADVLKQAEAIAKAVADKMSANDHQGAALIGRPQAAMAAQTLLTIFDRVHGGFGDAPKFPQPVYLDLLLEVRERAGDAATRSAIDLALRLTLEKMATGGVFDQVGGGFHRYSVDRFWIVPHFEKMLYDNGQLLSTYAKASKVYGDEFYARVARRIGEYVLREMTSPYGAFFTAQDAEVDGREGLNYLWTSEELRGELSAEDAEFAIALYGLGDGPNFQDPHHPKEPPRNVLRLSARPEADAERLRMTLADFLARVDRVNATLLAERAKRRQPCLDDKIVTSWNGLMIGGLACAGRVLGEPRFVAAAKNAAEWLLSNMRDLQGGLLRSARDGVAHIPGVLDDYAMLAHGLLELHAASPAEHKLFLAEAINLMDAASDRFADGRGGFFDTRADRPDLFVRARSTYDGAMPSAVSVMFNNLVTLAERTGEPRFARAAAACAARISRAIAESPIATANSTRALLRLLNVDERTLVESLSAAGAIDLLAHAPSEAADQVVHVFASVKEAAPTAEEPVEFMLRLDIADGFHLNAADLGPTAAPRLEPLRIGIVGGTGVQVYADYPEGEALPDSGSDAPRVYTGSLTIPVVLERAGEWSGQPRLVITFQACTNTECHEPSRLMLDVELTRGPD